jgi:phage baseplate assembly protein gpV
MNKFKVSLAIVIVLALFISAANVLASPTAGSVNLDKPTSLPGGPPDKTKIPGAPATQKAIERATQGVGNPDNKKKTYKGIVASASASNLTLTLKDGSSVTFTITSDTKIQIPTLSRNAMATDIQVGAQALVQADSALNALRINIIPGRPVSVHRVGTVTAYTAGASITIQDKDGNSSTFTINADTKILPQSQAGQLAVGVRVTIISRRDPTGGQLAAQGIVVQSAKP